MDKYYEIRDSILAESLSLCIKASELMDNNPGLSETTDEIADRLTQEIVNTIVMLCKTHPECYNKEVGSYNISIVSYGKTYSTDIVWMHNGCIFVSSANPSNKCPITKYMEAPEFDYQIKTTDIKERCEDLNKRMRSNIIERDITDHIGKETLLSRCIADYIKYLTKPDRSKPRIDIIYRLASQITELRKAAESIESLKTIIMSDENKRTKQYINAYIHSDEFLNDIRMSDNELNSIDPDDNIKTLRDIRCRQDDLINKHFAALTAQLTNLSFTNYFDIKTILNNVYDLIGTCKIAISYFMKCIYEDGSAAASSEPIYNIANNILKGAEINTVMNKYTTRISVPKANFTEMIEDALQVPTDNLLYSVTKTAADEKLYLDPIIKPAREYIPDEHLRTADKYEQTDIDRIKSSNQFWSNVQLNTMLNINWSMFNNADGDPAYEASFIKKLISDLFRSRSYSYYYTGYNLDDMMNQIRNNRKMIKEYTLSDPDIMIAYADGFLKDLAFYESTISDIQKALLLSDDAGFLKYLADTKVIKKSDAAKRLKEISKKEVSS